MDLTYEEIERYVEQISSRSKIVDIDNEVILFKQPETFTMMKARHVYDSEYKDSLDEGLLSAKDMQEILKKRNLISDGDRKKLSSLQSKLEAQKVLLAKTTKVKANQDRIKNVIHDLENQIRSLEAKERSKMAMTAETKAEEAKVLFLCWNCCYRFYDESIFWETYDVFLKESNLLFRQKVISEFILFYSGIPTPQIRAVARSNLWRIRYTTSLKLAEPLFGIPATDYTNDMLNLAYWSHYYQNIYEMMPEDQPSDLIIEDDEALDAYMKDYYDERSQDRASRKFKSKRRGKLSAFDQEEVIVTGANELYRDIEYDKPKEAHTTKDGNVVDPSEKRRRRNKSRIGTVPEKLPTK